MILDRFEAMSILLRVADTGSFSAASRELGVPLATVSRKVGELEAHLGTRLLTRTTRKLATTEAGAAYMARARRILDELDETERAAAGDFHAPRGELVVTAPVLFGRLHVLPIVVEFLGLYPEISVRFALADRNLHLVDDHVDMAARIGALPDSSIVATRVGAMRTVVCAGAKLLDAHGVPKAPEDLADFPTVNFDFMSQATTWPFRPKSAKGRVARPNSDRVFPSPPREAAVSAAVHKASARTRVLQLIKSAPTPYVTGRCG